SDKPPIKTPGELAIERGEPWPPPVAEPAFKAAIAQASQAAEAARVEAERSAHGANGSHGGQGAGDRQRPPNGPTRPDYGARAGLRRAGGRSGAGWPPATTAPGPLFPAPQPNPPAAALLAAADAELSRSAGPTGPGPAAVPDLSELSALSAAWPIRPGCCKIP